MLEIFSSPALSGGTPFLRLACGDQFFWLCHGIGALVPIPQLPYFTWVPVVHTAHVADDATEVRNVPPPYRRPLHLVPRDARQRLKRDVDALRRLDVLYEPTPGINALA